MANQEHVPFGQSVLFFAALLGFFLLKSWFLAWLGFDPRDTAGGWGWLLTGIILRTLRAMDALSDLGLSAIIYYKLGEGSCAWDGEVACAVYQQLLIVVSVAAGTDLLVSASFTFSDAAKAGRVHVALHVASLACEVALLTSTVILQQHGSQVVSAFGQGGANAAANSGPVDLFLVLSGALNLVTFSLNVMGIKNVVKGLRLCVRRIDFKAVAIQLSRPASQVAGHSQAQVSRPSSQVNGYSQAQRSSPSSQVDGLPKATPVQQEARITSGSVGSLVFEGHPVAALLSTSLHLHTTYAS